MNKELDERLSAKYPKIFPPLDGARGKQQLPWGFECGDGWFDLLDDLCAKIQHHVVATQGRQVVARQVKEKYGELRFYYDGADSVVDLLIEGAEARSELICEQCGAVGALTKSEHGWLRTRCAVHVE
ncbi:MAG: hypothetical protein ACOH2R_24155 [Pseudomonas sp.]